MSIYGIATGHSGRFARFLTVGASGIVVNIAALYLCSRVCHLPTILAAVLATECGTLNNFTLNDRWTFADCRGGRCLRSRLVRYHMCTGIGVMLAIAVFTGLLTVLSLNYLVADLIAIGTATLWYYASNSRLTWVLPTTARSR